MTSYLGMAEEKWFCNCRASVEELLCVYILSILRCSVVPKHWSDWTSLSSTHQNLLFSCSGDLSCLAWSMMSLTPLISQCTQVNAALFIFIYLYMCIFMYYLLLNWMFRNVFFVINVIFMGFCLYYGRTYNHQAIGAGCVIYISIIVRTSHSCC